MKKKTLLISSILASSMLIGGAFAAYAVTDNADPFGISIRTNDGEEAPTAVTLEWGDNVYADLDDILPGHIYKSASLSLKSSVEYTGLLRLRITDTSENKTNESAYLRDYLKLYIYSGANTDIAENTLPSTGLLASSSLGQDTLSYSAQGSPSGITYSVFVEFSNTSLSVYHAIINDIVTLTIDWNQGNEEEYVNPEPGDPTPVEPNYNKVYLASSWDDAYLYSWGDNGINRDYPGVPMKKIGVNTYNQYIYEGELNTNDNGFLFANEEGDQTTDITVTSDLATTQKLFWQENESVGSGIFNKASDVVRYDANLGSNPGPILQAWGWTTSKVLSELTNIKNSGFKAVQLSPMQPLGSGYQNQGWYMAYSPMGFSVATGDYGKYSPFGDDDSLKELTAAADELGIDIIMDVICNHLGAGSDYRLNSMSSSLEPTIYRNGGTDSLIHTMDTKITNNYDNQLIVRGNLDTLPDLQTENPIVQGRVISMLKEYIDCGVKGFRFDAAKHIETPDDGEYASDFWPNVIGSINEYGISKYGKAPYSYGEVLHPGDNRQSSWYTKYIDITDDSDVSDAKTAIFNNSNLSNAAKQYLFVGDKRNAVLYGETHDNYASYSGYAPDIRKIDMAYGIHTSRADVSTFYFARPTGDTFWGTNIVVDDNLGTDYRRVEVAEANKLHNDFEGGGEYISFSDNCIINLRSLGDHRGVYICSPSLANSASISIEGGIDTSRTYTNVVTGETVSYSNGKWNVNLVNGVAILREGTIDHTVVPTSGFGIKIVRGTSTLYYQAVDTGTVSYGKHVYLASSVPLEAGDKMYMYDGNNSVAFNCKDSSTLYLGDGCGSAFTYQSDHVLVNSNGTFNVQLQLASNDDSYYIYK